MTLELASRHKPREHVDTLKRKMVRKKDEETHCALLVFLAEKEFVSQLYIISRNGRRVLWWSTRWMGRPSHAYKREETRSDDRVCLDLRPRGLTNARASIACILSRWSPLFSQAADGASARCRNRRAVFSTQAACQIYQLLKRFRNRKKYKRCCGTDRDFVNASVKVASTAACTRLAAISNLTTSRLYEWRSSDMLNLCSACLSLLSHIWYIALYTFSYTIIV